MTDTPPEHHHAAAVVLHAGAPPAITGARVVDITPAEATEAAALDALRASGLAQYDMRTRVVFATGTELDEGCSLDQVFVAYAAACGFAGRLLDVFVGTALYCLTPPDAARLVASTSSVPVGQLASKLLAAGNPEATVEDCVRVGDGPEALTAIDPLDPDGAARLRAARRARLAPPAKVADAVGTLLLCSLLRRRDTLDRLPYLTDGTEPLGEDHTAAAGIDLDAIRRSARSLRRSVRSDDRSATAEAVELTDRQRRLVAAAAADVTDALERIGAQRADVVLTDAGISSIWHCPRADTHRNGDASASLQVVGNRAQCLRCDAERLDTLRLVMSVRGVTADEAADLLVADTPS